MQRMKGKKGSEHLEVEQPLSMVNSMIFRSWLLPFQERPLVKLSFVNAGFDSPEAAIPQGLLSPDTHPSALSRPPLPPLISPRRPLLPDSAASERRGGTILRLCIGRLLNKCSKEGS